jgi:hypothetical protein
MKIATIIAMHIVVILIVQICINNALNMSLFKENSKILIIILSILFAFCRFFKSLYVKFNIFKKVLHIK